MISMTKEAVHENYTYLCLGSSEKGFTVVLRACKQDKTVKAGSGTHL